MTKISLSEQDLVQIVLKQMRHHPMCLLGGQDPVDVEFKFKKLPGGYIELSAECSLTYKKDLVEPEERELDLESFDLLEDAEDKILGGEPMQRLPVTWTDSGKD